MVYDGTGGDGKGRVGRGGLVHGHTGGKGPPHRRGPKTWVRRDKFPPAREGSGGDGEGGNIGVKHRHPGGKNPHPALGARRPRGQRGGGGPGRQVPLGFAWRNQTSTRGTPAPGSSAGLFTRKLD